MTDREFLERIRPHFSDLKRYAQRVTYDAEQGRDLFQDTLARAWENRHRFDERPVHHLMITIMKRCWLDQKRVQRAKKRKADIVRDVDINQVLSSAHYSQPFNDEISPEIQSALADLSPAERELFLVYAEDAYSGREIAERFGMLEVTCRVKIGRIRKKLAEALQNLER